MKDKHKVDKVEHVWSEKEDRWLYIEYNEQRKVIGLNFTQGDDYDLSLIHISEPTRRS